MLFVAIVASSHFFLFFFFFFLMLRLPPRSTPLYSSAASEVYKSQAKFVRFKVGELLSIFRYVKPCFSVEESTVWINEYSVGETEILGTRRSNRVRKRSKSVAIFNHVFCSFPRYKFIVRRHSHFNDNGGRDLSDNAITLQFGRGIRRSFTRCKRESFSILC